MSEPNPDQPQRIQPTLGCLGLALILFFLCLMPFLWVDLMQTALQKLHLRPDVAMIAVVGILVGGLVNLPVHYIEREEAQPVEPIAVFGFRGGPGPLNQFRQNTIIAVNVGGCVIPGMLALWQIVYLMEGGGRPWVALCIASATNIAVCYYVARPVRGVGIAMPWFVSPAVAVGMAWLMLGPPAYDPMRAPVAFVAGVLGPLVGADLLHLRDFTKVSMGVLSIGGAGTFDGIVLSGLLAALLT